MVGVEEVTRPSASLDAGTPRRSESERYVLGERLGAGGMGIVWAARDRALDRDIAIKVLHDAFLGSSNQQRLAEEARTMARLTHPNVVAVYDVGERDGRTFIAMERVRGTSLATWVGQARPWRAIVGVFRAAGTGLAAAHAAGVTHRDVKPSNILIGDDGCAKLTDFGVAAQTKPEGIAVSSLRSLATAGTAGTPVYMAPERLRGEVASTASDQFSFAVALYEVLHGRLPFAIAAADDALPALVRAIEQGAPPPVRSVPRWLHAVVTRGLAADPARRFPSMEAMVAALAGPRWHRSAAVALGGTALAAALVLVVTRASAGESCRVELHEVWDESVKARLAARFAAAGTDYTATTWTAVARALDDHAARWVTMSEASCRAKRDGTQTAETFERRHLCLEQRRAELQRFTQIYDRTLTPDLVAGAPRVAAELVDIEVCLAPSGQQRASGIDRSARDRLALARLHFAAGANDDASRAAASVVDDAGRLGDRELEIEALLTRATIELDAGRVGAALEFARTAAGRTTDDARLRADTWLTLASALRGADLFAESEEALDRADAVLAEHPDRLLAHSAAIKRGDLEFARSNFAGALTWYERASRLGESLFGANSWQQAAVAITLTETLRTLGRVDEALVHGRRAVALSAILGRSHPQTLKARASLAETMASAGRYDEVLAELRSILAEQRKQLGDHHADLAVTYHSIGHARAGLYQLEEAAFAYQAALAIMQPTNPDGQATMLVQISLASVLGQLNKFGEAEALYASLEVRQSRELGPTHLTVANTRIRRAWALNNLGRPEEAAPLIALAQPVVKRTLGDRELEYASLLIVAAETARQRRRNREWLGAAEGAYSILVEKAPASDPGRISATFNLATARAAAGKPVEAIAAAEEAVTAAEATGSAELLGMAHQVLVQVLWDTGRDRSRAIAIARDATTKADPETRKYLAAWLAKVTRK
jgi:serine/threonine-protein kinase